MGPGQLLVQLFPFSSEMAAKSSRSGVEVWVSEAAGTGQEQPWAQGSDPGKAIVLGHCSRLSADGREPERVLAAWPHVSLKDCGDDICPACSPRDLVSNNTPDLDPEPWAPVSNCLATSLLGHLYGAQALISVCPLPTLPRARYSLQPPLQRRGLHPACSAKTRALPSKPTPVASSAPGQCSLRPVRKLAVLQSRCATRPSREQQTSFPPGSGRSSGLRRFPTSFHLPRLDQQPLHLFCYWDTDVWTHSDSSLSLVSQVQFLGKSWRSIFKYAFPQPGLLTPPLLPWPEPARSVRAVSAASAPPLVYAEQSGQ